MSIIIIIAFVLNFVWEITQMPLYQGYAFDAKHIAFCGLASVADAIMVLLLYLVFATLYKQPLLDKTYKHTAKFNADSNRGYRCNFSRAETFVTRQLGLCFIDANSTFR
jgi:hypothetical protein